MGRCEGRVDIETEWNLKSIPGSSPRPDAGRYRNRVEFKDYRARDQYDRRDNGRYRNRVEFKGVYAAPMEG